MGIVPGTVPFNPPTQADSLEGFSANNVLKVLYKAHGKKCQSLNLELDFSMLLITLIHYSISLRSSALD
jgi:hypothetical protein